MKKATRAEAYLAIDSERDYHQQTWPNGEDGDNPLTVGEFAWLIQGLLDEANKSWRYEGKPNLETLGYMRKIAATAVNCMEQHGAPKR